MRRPSKSDSLRFLIASGLPVGTVLDVGVQDRTIELMECFPDTPHILFEPDTTQRETIHRNYERIDHVLVEAAVHHTSGFIEVAANGKLSSGLAAFRPTRGDSTEQIPAIALDTWLDENPVKTPYLLKIDVEGGEQRTGAVHGVATHPRTRRMGAGPGERDGAAHGALAAGLDLTVGGLAQDRDVGGEQVGAELEELAEPAVDRALQGPGRVARDDSLG